MRTLYADQNFNQHIVLGILEAAPEVHVAPIRQFGLRCADDPDLLEWLAERDGILMSHDFSTVPHFANDRLRRGLPLAGVLLTCALPMPHGRDARATWHGRPAHEALTVRGSIRRSIAWERLELRSPI